MSNQNWYKVEPLQSDLKELEDMFWSFHDFRISDIHYIPQTDTLDILFEYDDHNLLVLLRFIGKICMNLLYSDDYETDWISGSTLYIDKNNQIVWVYDEIKDESEISADTMYIKSNRLHYAIVNRNGDALPIPESIIHQKYQRLNFSTGTWEYSERNFSPKSINSDLS